MALTFDVATRDFLQKKKGGGGGCGVDGNGDA